MCYSRIKSCIVCYSRWRTMYIPSSSKSVQPWITSVNCKVYFFQNWFEYKNLLVCPWWGTTKTFTALPHLCAHNLCPNSSGSPRLYREAAQAQVSLGGTRQGCKGGGGSMHLRTRRDERSRAPIHWLTSIHKGLFNNRRDWQRYLWDESIINFRNIDRFTVLFKISFLVSLPKGV